MNIISSLPLSRLASTESSSPARRVNSQRSATTLPARPDTYNGRPDSSRQQNPEIRLRADFNNDRLDLRLLSDPSLSLTSQRAIVSYSVTARIEELTSGQSNLDISV